MDWHPGCVYSGSSYYYGAIYRRGPSGILDTPITILPACMQFVIKLKNNDKDLYGLVKQMLSDLKNERDQIDIRGGIPKYITEKINIKIQYKIRKQYDDLTSQLEELGCEINDISGPKYISILDEWFEWKEYHDYKVSFSIGCHNGTKFYKYLQENKLLEKYFPE